MREAWEEAGLDPSTYTVRGAYVDDHGNWTYTTVLAETGSLVTPRAPSTETTEVAWVRLDDLATLPLHPGSAASWPAVSAALLGHAHTLRTTPAPSGLEQPPRPGGEEMRGTSVGPRGPASAGRCAACCGT
jgi:hypothetical protein